jgi:hypothetical protein
VINAGRVHRGGVLDWGFCHFCTPCGVRCPPPQCSKHAFSGVLTLWYIFKLEKYLLYIICKIVEISFKKKKSQRIEFFEGK